MKPDVSVIIPTYDRPQKTRRAINSVLRQDSIAVELIVVDDASPVPLELSQEERDRGVRIITQSKNAGPAAARNAGVAASTAPFIGFLDSDDFFLPDTLARRVEEARRSGSDARPTLLVCPAWRWAPGQSIIQYTPIEAEKASDFVKGCWYCPGSASLFSRETWEAVGPFDETLRRLEDLDWGIRLGLRGGRLRVTSVPAAVIERSPRAGLRNVENASNILKARYRPDRSDGLRAEDAHRLRAYLALERASSSLGEGRWPSFVLNMLASFGYRPRLSLHLERWWAIRDGTAEDLASIERLARSLGDTSGESDRC